VNAKTTMKVAFGHKEIKGEQDYMKRRRRDKRRQEEDEGQGREQEEFPRPDAFGGAFGFLGAISSS
jgi:hypothetical protein